MTYLEALDALTDPAKERLRWLCSILNPDNEQREAYRALVMQLASGEAPPAPTHDAPLIPVTGRCCGG